MKGKIKLLLNWLAGSLLLLAVFYAAVSWLWRASEESAATSLRSQVFSALAGDLSEGNLFKLGAAMTKLRQEGYIRFAEIRQVRGGMSSPIYKTSGTDDGLQSAFSNFTCGGGYRLLRVAGGGVGIVTVLPTLLSGAECTAVFISSDLPADLKKLKTKITVSFGALIILVMGFILILTILWHKKVVVLEVVAKTAVAEKEAAIGRMAAQVAHDIRSPLAALNSVLKDVSQFPEEKRLMIREAVSRIGDIANNLLEKNRQSRTAAGQSAEKNGPSPKEPLESLLLSSLIEPVVTEKRLQFRDRLDVGIDSNLGAGSYGLFSNIQPVEFKRVLSNLLNNAVEALFSYKSQDTSHKPEEGIVVVSLSAFGGKALIEVKDTGKGIPPEILAKLGQRGETHGKAGGSGLGLYHAKTAIESWGGSLNIQSEAGKGTTLTLTLPQAEPPGWFVSELKFSADSPVVILDDDTSIHQVWKGRFESARVNDHGITVFNFSTPEGLRQWVKSNSKEARKTVYLFDYELLGHKETGLSLAEELGIADKTILVTSRYEEPNVMEGCKRLELRLIPKNLAGLVPISISAAEKKTSAAPAAQAAGRRAVLLDDDMLVHMNWKMAARAAGVELKAYKIPEDFAVGIEALSKDTPIYIDSELGNNVKGEDIAKDLHKKGFTNISMATGHGPEKFAHLPWLKAAGKEPPFGAGAGV